MQLTLCQNGISFSHSIDRFFLFVGQKLSEATEPPANKRKICPSKGNLVNL